MFDKKHEKVITVWLLVISPFVTACSGKRYRRKGSKCTLTFWCSNFMVFHDHMVTTGFIPKRELTTRVLNGITNMTSLADNINI